MSLREFFAHYPEQQAAWRTSDGLLHLTPQHAAAQASHLTDPRIRQHKRPAPATPKGKT